MQMQLALTLVPILILLAITTCGIQLSALLLRYRVQWVHALMFAIAFVVLSIAAQGVSVRWGVAAGAGIGILLELALAGWFFGTRGKRITGEPIGWTHGALLVIVAQLILAALGLALIFVVRALRG